jgi:hypothetical protein
MDGCADLLAKATAITEAAYLRKYSVESLRYRYRGKFPGSQSLI